MLESVSERIIERTEESGCGWIISGARSNLDKKIWTTEKFKISGQLEIWTTRIPPKIRTTRNLDNYKCGQHMKI